MQIHHWGLHWKDYWMGNSPFLTSSLNCNWKWRIWFHEPITSLWKAPGTWTSFTCLTPPAPGKLSACKSCNTFIIYYIILGSWPRLFVIPAAEKQAVVPWEQLLERAVEEEPAREPHLWGWLFREALYAEPKLSYFGRSVSTVIYTG